MMAATFIGNASALSGAAWQKSHHSNPSGECVELALLPDGRVAMRNSRDPGGPAILFARDAVEELLDSARCGEPWLWELVDDDTVVQGVKGGVVIRGEDDWGSGPCGPFPQVGLDHHC